MIKLYCVEHCRTDGGQTFEIFRTLAEAENFAKEKKNWDSTHFPLYIFSADFNEEYVYEEDDGNLNYEDCYGTMNGEYEMVEVLNEKLNWSEK